jgi:hypothetical protein
MGSAIGRIVATGLPAPAKPSCPRLEDRPLITPNTGIGAFTTPTLRTMGAKLDEAARSPGQPKGWRQTGSQGGG